MNLRHRALVLRGAPLLALIAATAQLNAQGLPKPDVAGPKLAPFAPSWKKGDTWVVRTFLREVENEGRPRARSRVPRIPGYPPLHDGVPEGFTHGNRWRFEVARTEDVRHADDARTDPPERFIVIAARTLEGDEPRTAELWFASRDLLLARVVVGPRTPKESATWLKGTIQLDVASGRELAFPLDWPDLAAAAKLARVEGPVEGAPSRLQDVTEEKGSWLVTLREKGSKGGEESQTHLRFRKGAPWWVSFEDANVHAVLEEGAK